MHNFYTTFKMKFLKKLKKNMIFFLKDFQKRHENSLQPSRNKEFLSFQRKFVKFIMREVKLKFNESI